MPNIGSAAITSEYIRDTIAAALVQGSGIAITPNDALDTITIASTSVPSLLLNAGASVPGGTAIGTLIFRKV